MVAGGLRLRQKHGPVTIARTTELILEIIRPAARVEERRLLLARIHATEGRQESAESTRQLLRASVLSICARKPKSLARVDRHADTLSASQPSSCHASSCRRPTA